MLSIDNPPPATDLTCHLPQLITSSPLKSINGGDDEKASSSSTSSGKLVEKVDLPQAVLDEKYSNNPPPYFSIRDYVFSSRSKNIKTNWPFSEKSLELCLEHGVKELLPPFHSVDNLRCAVENTLADKQDINVLHDDQSTPCDNDSLPPTSHHTESANINSSGTEGDKVYPCSEINSVPASKSSCLEFGTKVIGPNKVLPGKKSSSTAKLSNTTEEENKTSNLAILESMASKTCPVCKSFSSSSNTTLNAHIDRCLSGEPKTVKWASSSNCEASKHRMRPRKTRLMTDIYATAQYCTLEDLDRRNGTTFAVCPSFSAPEMDGCSDDNNENPSPIDTEKTCDEGAVYIDANGTKLRILSKLNEGNATCSKKFTKGDKGSKFLSIKKKKKKKHKNNSLKYVKIMTSALTSAAHSKNVCSRGPQISEKRGVQERSFVRKLITGKEQCPTQHIRSQDNNKMGNEHLSNSYANRSCSSRNVNSPLETACFPKSHKILEDLECESSDDHNEQLNLKKKASFPMLDRYIVPRKGKKAKLSKADDHPSAHYSGGSTKNDMNQSPSHRKPKVNVNAAIPRNDDISTVTCKTYIYRHHHAFSSKAKKFSSLRKLKGAVRSQVPSMPTSHADYQQYNSAEDQIDGLRPTWDAAKKANILRTKKEERKKDCERDSGRDNTSDNNNSSTFSFGSVSSSSGESDDDRDEMGPASELYARKKLMNFSKHEANSGTGDSLDLRADHARLFGDDEEFDRPFICDQEIFCDVGKTAGADEFQGGYCGHLEVDSIPIPGPPGSFIPSPGRTCSGEEELHQAYSSLASSRLHQSSSEETSPVSATSTLSNFTRSSDKPTTRNPWLYSTIEENKSSLSNDSIDHHHTLSLVSSQDPPQLFQRQTTANTPTTPLPVGPMRLETNLNLFKLSVDTDHQVQVPRRAESASPSSACKPVIRLMGKDVSVDPTDDEIVSPQANPNPPPSQTSFAANKAYFQARDPQMLFYNPPEDTKYSNMRTTRTMEGRRCPGGIWLHSSGYSVPMSHGGLYGYNDRPQLESSSSYTAASFGVNAAAVRGGVPPLTSPPPPSSTGRNLLPSCSVYYTSGF